MTSFKILKSSPQSNARLGILSTPHGEVETPCLVPVATQAVIKTLTSEEVIEIGYKLLISNTFHLHLKPGEDVVEKAGKLHKFMNWSGGLMTDSGGFQVFSLGFGRDHGVGKILKEKSDEVINEGQQPKNIKISEDGVTFRSPYDGHEIFLGPKESMAIQEKLGADIIFAFDEATSPVANEEYTKNSLDRTHRWAKLCLEHKTSDQALYGIVQGGKFPALRKESAAFTGSLPFDGFGIGGEYGDDKKKMIEMINISLAELPNEKPRHLLGIGHPEDIPEIMKAGIDTFDCIAPTHYARRGVAFISPAGTRLDLNKTPMLQDFSPIDPTCTCSVCGSYTRSYITHLIRAHEITGLKLISYHNLFWFNSYVKSLREKIKNNEL